MVFLRDCVVLLHCGFVSFEFSVFPLNLRRL